MTTESMADVQEAVPCHETKIKSLK